jgi:DNA-directed RNA polymerase subunit M/transcription elongation factor TFIIS
MSQIDHELKILMYIMNFGGFSHLDGMDNPEFAEKKFNELKNVKTEEELFNTIIFDEQRKINNMKIEKLSGKNETNNASKCPKCQGDRYYVDEQRRAGDEARTFEIRCPGCRFVQKLST